MSASVDYCMILVKFLTGNQVATSETHRFQAELNCWVIYVSVAFKASMCNLLNYKTARNK